MPSEFVIFTTQRSGSTWLVDLLDIHPELRVYGEMLLENGQGQRFAGAQDFPFLHETLTETGLAGAGPERAAHVARYLDGLFRLRPGDAAVGFKMMYGQFGAYPELRSILSDRGIGAVHLVRDNLLDVLISKQSAVERALFHARDRDAVPDVKIEMNIGALIRHLEEQEAEIERARRLLDELGWTHLEVRYETLVRDPDAVRPVLEYLGVRDPGQRLVSGLRKINTRPRSELVVNFSELAAQLSGTRFERHIDDANG